MAKKRKIRAHGTQKKLRPAAKAGRPGNTPKAGSRRQGRSGKAKKNVKPLAKNTPLHKGRTPEKLRTNQRLKSSAKGSRGTRTNQEGRKRSLSAKTRSHKRVSKSIERRSGRSSGKTRVKITKHFAIDPATGKRKKTNVGKGWQDVFEVRLKGDAKKGIEKTDFSFLNAALNKNVIEGVPKVPKGVTIKIERTYRGKKHYSGRISDITFVPTAKNIKGLVLDRLEELEEDWSEYIEENAQEAIDEDGEVKLLELTESGRALNPKNVTMISIQIIY